jgi:hypothetical protein
VICGDITIFSINIVGMTEYPHGKKNKNLDPYLKLCVKINILNLWVSSSNMLKERRNYHSDFLLKMPCKYHI